MQSTLPDHHHHQQQQQHQQQMIMTTSNQLQPAPQWVVTASRPTTTTVPNYMYRPSTVHGVILIIVGILSIVFNIVDLAVWSTGYQYHLRSSSSVGHGFWCGVMCIIAGGFGVGTGRRRSSLCQIRAFLVLSIIAACCCLGQLIAAVNGAAVASYDYSSGYGHDICCPGSCRYDEYHSYSSSSSTTCNSMRTIIAMEALLAILSFIGGIAAISGSVLGCRAACCCNCCCCVDPYPQQFTIVQDNGVSVTIVAQQQQGGQMVPVQYPAQYPMQQPMNYSPACHPAGGYGYVQPDDQFSAAPPY